MVVYIGICSRFGRYNPLCPFQEEVCHIFELSILVGLLRRGVRPLQGLNTTWRDKKMWAWVHNSGEIYTHNPNVRANTHRVYI